MVPDTFAIAQGISTNAINFVEPPIPFATPDWLGSKRHRRRFSPSRLQKASKDLMPHTPCCAPVSSRAYPADKDVPTSSGFNNRESDKTGKMKD